MMDKRKTVLYIFYDEESLKDRKDKVRGLATLHQLEHLHIISKNGLQVPPRPRLKFSGTTTGDMLGPVAMPASAPQPGCFITVP